MNSYQQAQEAVRQIEQELAGWHQQQADRQHELERLKASAAKRLADGVPPSTLARESAMLADEIGFLDQVITGVKAKLAPAQHEVQMARIADMRRQADEMEAQAQPILEQRAALLQQLEELEGKAYMAEPRSQLLMVQAQRLRDNATVLEARLSYPDTTERDAAGNELRRVVGAVS